MLTLMLVTISLLQNVIIATGKVDLLKIFLNVSFAIGKADILNSDNPF
jgi:hypothetical protein